MKLVRFVFIVMVIAVLGFSITAGAADKVKVGYLHTLAVDGQFWIGMNKGYFQEQGLEMEPILFTSGVPMMQALSGGSVDVAIMGAVISNFPSRGVGKVFLINDIEWNTASLWARPETKAKKIQDVKGQKIATVKGTTAHVFLHTALKANGIDSGKDVEIVSMDMAGAVSAFISGAVPFVCTWEPFPVQIREKVAGAVMLSSAKEFYPNAAIIGGWVASNKFHEQKKDVLKKIVKAWAKANDELVSKPEESLKLIHSKAYSNIPFSDIKASWNAQKCETSKDWVKLYEDGTVSKWIGQVEKVFVEIGSIGDWVDPKNFFDPSIFLEVMKGK
ncbi:MAG: ABC transporter substrate-binding protein [Desulfobacteraceae bacterium]|nr:MAG: ABC transporter substrate-binding protein [Desulfobacteraceae bacterium]